MAGSNPSQEEDKSPAADEKIQHFEKRLSVVLAKLERDERNPDLWIEAAEASVGVGNLREALKCTEACLRIDAGHWDAKILAAGIEELLRVEEEAKTTLKREGGPEGVLGRQRQTAPPSTAKPEVGPERESVRSVSEGQRPRFGSEAEALEQLRKELSPSKTVVCRHCNTLVEIAEKLCYGCGREMRTGGRTLEQRAAHSRARLQRDERDRDALFTLGSYLALQGQHPEALELLHRLTKLDPKYPGLWWLKARVFRDIGKLKAARSAVGTALRSSLGPNSRNLM
jgi:tetratricopeptide (TPR) repeat protein